jgi:hypothetical protein
VPEAWLVGEVVPIPKDSTNASDPKTYRGITLESCGLKFLATVLTARLQEWANACGLLPDEQNGFRTGFRTENSPFVLHSILERARFERRDVFTAFIDLAKAFDSVDRNLLWLKMDEAGAKGPAFNLIRFIYAQMVSQVRLGKERSFKYRTELGVLQGDPMSGMLWIIYIASIERELESTGNSPHIAGKPIRLLLMADDICLIAYSNDELNLMLNSLARYCDKNLLTISAPKSVAVSFRVQRQTDDPTPPSLHGSLLPVKNGARYIGIHFAESDPLAYETHIATLARSANWKCYTLLEMIRISRGKIPLSEVLRVYDTEIRTKMLFGAEITISAKHLKPMEAVEKTFLRRLLKISDSSSVEALYLETGLVPISLKQLEKALNFFVYASSSDAPPLVRSAMYSSFQLPQDLFGQRRAWSQCFRERLANFFNDDLLSRILSLVDTPQGFDWSSIDESKKAFANAIMRQVVNSTREEMQEQIIGNAKLTILKILPIRTKFASYLDVLPPAHRNSMTRIRLAEHSLGIELGRRDKVPRERRICRFCPRTSPFVEDELHILGCCLGSMPLVQARVRMISELAALKLKELDGGRCSLVALRNPRNWSFLLDSDSPEVITVVGHFVHTAVQLVAATAWKSRR